MDYFINDIRNMTGVSYHMAKEVYYNLDIDFDASDYVEFEAEVDRVLALMRENLINEVYLR